jgi:hypothetical protein
MKGLLLAAGIAALFLATGTAHAHDPIDNPDPDWIFQCPEGSNVGNVYIYEFNIYFTVRGIRPPFQLAWADKLRGL